jgi:site-specific DNA recombinase
MLKLSLDKDYKAAIYLRLSKEDGDFSISGEKLESDSISNQRMLIKEYRSGDTDTASKTCAKAVPP